MSIMKTLGLVQEVSHKDCQAGWLFGFDINSRRLKTSHKRWLERRVVKPMAAADARNRQRGMCDGLQWQIWVVGAASRTGSAEHNRKLSRRRADEVGRYLSAKLGRLDVMWDISSYATGEALADIKGRQDEVESDLDRSVLVIAQPYRENMPTPPMPKIPRPRSREVLSVNFCFAARRLTLANIDKWTGSLYASASSRHTRFGTWWPVFGRGLSVDPSVINVGFTPPGQGEANVFAGYQTVEFADVAAVDRLNKKYISVGTATQVASN